MARIRADRLLVERGIFHSRAAAQAAIEAGGVKIDGKLVTKAAQPIPETAEIEAAPAHPYVSRGGVKLAAALAHFGVDPRGKVCLDIGASTGGFTDVLLRAGARRVYAVDVGTGQLHPSLRGRREVVAMESTDIRKIDSACFPEPPAFIVVDVSFISLKLVLPAATALAAPEAQMIALVKPQFEAGRKALRKGVVRDPQVHATICDGIAAFAGSLGWDVKGIIESPIEGGDGNREFLLGAAREAAA